MAEAPGAFVVVAEEALRLVSAVAERFAIAAALATALSFLGPWAVVERLMPHPLGLNLGLSGPGQ